MDLLLFAILSFLKIYKKKSKHLLAFCIFLIILKGSRYRRKGSISTGYALLLLKKIPATYVSAIILFSGPKRTYKKIPLFESQYGVPGVPGKQKSHGKNV